MRSRQGKRRALAAAVFVALATGCGGENGPEPEEQSPPPAPAGPASVVLQPLEGPQRTIADYGGWILVVNFFSTWSKDSQALMPIMNEIQRAFVANVKVIGIAVDDRGEAALRSFVRENEPRFDIFMGGAAVAGRFGGAGRIPTTYFLSREARVYGRIEGLKEYRHYHDFVIGMYKKRM